MYARHAAWLGGVDRFDAALFGFSKAQATATDPQVSQNKRQQFARYGYTEHSVGNFAPPANRKQALALILLDACKSKSTIVP